MADVVKLDDDMLDSVAGGNYYINKNNLKVAFTTIPGVAFQLHGCSGNDAMDIMDALIGKYATVEEYDQACVDALRVAGYLD